MPSYLPQAAHRNVPLPTVVTAPPETGALGLRRRVGLLPSLGKQLLKFHFRRFGVLALHLHRRRKPTGPAREPAGQNEPGRWMAHFLALGLEEKVV